MTKTNPAPIVGTSATSPDVKSTTSSVEAPTENSSTTQETSSPSVQPVTDSQPIINRLRKDCKECLAVIWSAREKLTGEMTLHEAVERRAEVIANRSRLTSICNQVGDINNEVWLKLRPDYNSDAATTRAVEATDAGRIQKKLEAEIKMAGTISSALADKIRLAEEELRGM